MNRILTLIALFISSLNLIGQSYGSKEYYLVDSIDLSTINKYDKVLLDSTLELYHAAKNDTQKIKTLGIIIESSNDDNLWPKYNKYLLELCNQLLKENNSKEVTLFLKKEKAGALNNIGYYYSNSSHLDEALRWYVKSLKIQQEINNKSGAASTINNIGQIYLHQGNIPKALDHFERSLKINEELNNEESIANSLNNLGYIYKLEGDVESAYNYYKKGLEIQKRINDIDGMSVMLSNIGAILMLKDSMELARKYFKESIALKKKRGNLKGMFFSINNLGISFSEEGLIDSAIYYQLKCLEIAKEINDKECYTIAYDNLANNYLSINKLNLSENYALKSLQYAKEIGYPDKIRNAAMTLSTVYKNQEIWEKAFKFQSLYHQMNDSIINEKNRNASYKQKIKHEFEKKEELMRLEEEKNNAIYKQRQLINTIVIWSISIGLGISLVLAIIILQRYRVIRNQKQIIDTQHADLEKVNYSLNKKSIQVLDSINYAQKLQRSILNSEDDLHQVFADSFLFIQPKDIVSGDYFWILQHENLTFLAVIDCTGHGIPGAMISILSHTILEKGVLENGITDPAELLNFSHHQIINKLRSNNKNDDVNDGFDTSLFVFNHQTQTVKFTGAHNYALVVSNGTPRLLEADNLSVGIRDQNQSFTSKTLDINAGDWLYLFSDGYRDQIGEKTGKKLYYKYFEELLVNISNLPPANQKQQLELYFNDWKGSKEQLDDVTVLGIKL